MRVLSLFDGCAGAYLALKNIRVTPSVYIASEIDKYAMKVAKANFPDIIHIGDIDNISHILDNKYGPFDLIIGGSPCQDLSITRSDRKGLNGIKSSLFWKLAFIIENMRSKYFLVENVASMSKESKDTISSVLGVDPILINSSLLTAQNRKRYYWTNILGVQQPEDKQIFLKVILIHNPQVLDDCKVNKTPSRDIMWYGGKCKDITNSDKSSCITSKQDRWDNAGLLSYKGYCRFLHPIECERLQGMPDNYTNYVSKTQRYKMIGGGFTISVISQILKFMIKE